MKLDLKNYNRIVIKIGSSLIISEGKLREDWLEKLSKNISDFISNNIEIIIVTSGAVALGKSILKLNNKKLSIEQKQACAAVGQIELMSFYKKIFNKNNYQVAQILLTASDCNSRVRYLNCKNTIENLLKNQVIPIINENDSIANEEIKIGDNDRLAARVAQMSSADLMILLSDIDGLYDKNPTTHKDAKFISEVKNITKEIENMAGSSTSSIGTGGMITKIIATKMALSINCQVIITSGIENNCLEKLKNNQKKFTFFYSQKKSLKTSKHITTARKSWLSGVVNARGEAIINNLACETIKNKKVSLLPIGVVSIKGKFSKGDVIFVKDLKGKHIASGITNYSSDEAKKIIQKKSNEVKKIFGNDAKSELIHLNNLVLTDN